MCGGAVSALDPEFSIQVWSAEAAAQPPPRIEPSGPRPCQLSGLVTRRLSPSRFKGPRPCQLPVRTIPGVPAVIFTPAKILYFLAERG